MAVPLVAEATVIGVMTVYGPAPLTEDCSRRLEMIAPRLAIAVSSAVTARTGMNPGALATLGAIVGSQLARARG